MNNAAAEYSCFRQGAERLKKAMAGIPNRVPVFARRSFE